jgi:hypothetical protein
VILSSSKTKIYRCAYEAAAFSTNNFTNKKIKVTLMKKKSKYEISVSVDFPILSGSPGHTKMVSPNNLKLA